MWPWSEKCTSILRDSTVQFEYEETKKTFEKLVEAKKVFNDLDFEFTHEYHCLVKKKKLVWARVSDMNRVKHSIVSGDEQGDGGSFIQKFVVDEKQLLEYRGEKFFQFKVRVLFCHLVPPSSCR